MLNDVLKSKKKMVPTNVRANVKQQKTKELVAV